MSIARPYTFNRPELPRCLLLPCLIAWLLTTIFFLGLGIYGFYQNHLFAINAHQTQGKVDKKFEQISAGRGARLRFLAYSYVVAGTSYFSTEIPVTPATWFHVELHGNIPLKYLSQNPSNSRIDLPTEDGTNQVIPAGPIAIGVCLLIFGLAYGRDKNRRRRFSLNSGPSSS
jgi:hypothetical protein